MGLALVLLPSCRSVQARSEVWGRVGRFFDRAKADGITPTSPDHGTAFRIAARGVASPRSFANAVKVARRLLAWRAGSGGQH